ncbi:zinc-regulated transporter 1 [Nannizzia gypsea CBS 118893]|uniref:Zinc-regulated transporter 1 n=1 Tax=Arthroderma gypseum (strain ATCC MYA-4604 / CBS 118893) TaxID=535722 RepID=E4UXS4_ARTGP|nr:zinc-regulated transporter 1 [Nannizzia gypsea CBS 118893]EFR01969.1 zinc-regulated transporter 1 [Nannizzia gypsea CBS 118893]
MEAPALSGLDAIPLDKLKDEYLRRSCGSKKTNAYNTPAHVAALFLILALSTFACAFPIIARRFPKLPIPRRFLFLSRHFGTGVLIATAFVHLLPTAFISLTSPCLPRFWNKGYPAFAGLVAMVAVLMVVCIEMFFAMKGAGHVHGSEYDTLIGDMHHDHDHGHGHENGSSVQMGKVRRKPPARIVISASTENLVDGASPLMPNGNGRAQLGGETTDPSDDEDLDIDLEELDPQPDDNESVLVHSRHQGHAHHHHRHHSHDNHMSEQSAQKQLLQCLLLEAGILFHSIFIGMALSVATGANFLVLLVAISFHQTFEGFALGARIAALIPALFPASSPKPWLMALAYGATTPIGQAIGLGVHNLYDPASTTGLLMVGLTNAFSSGLLLFAGLVELLAEDFLSDRSYETLQGRNRLEAGIAVAAGASLMALVGAFA